MNGPCILHAQDCIAARAAGRIRDADRFPALAGVRIVRTVHHCDDFTTAVLVECQRRSIHDPDRVLVVSKLWRDILACDYEVDAEVVPNGIDPGRFGTGADGRRAAMRARVGVGDDGFFVLTVGGIEPRKGTATLFEAMALLKSRLDVPPVLGIVGGHSFQDYQAYRDAALARLPALGLELGRDVVLLGTVSDEELGGWYRAADAFAFPSVKEGFGLVVLEAMAMGLPVVATDIPVFAEYLSDGDDALLAPVGDAAALADALSRLALDSGLRGSTGLGRGRRGGTVHLGGQRPAPPRHLRRGRGDGDGADGAIGAGIAVAMGPVINGERWIRERLAFLRERLGGEVSDSEREAVEAEIAVLEQERGLTAAGHRAGRFFRRRRDGG